MAKKSDDKTNHSPRITNRRARHDYHILESFEVGIVLRGSEVKSLRAGQASIAEGFARVDPRSHDLLLHNVEISQYKHAAASTGHEPRRTRKLLAHRREINRLLDMTTSQGVTLVPLTLYFVRGIAKIELGVAKGKRASDKRETMKKRDAEREMQRAMSRKRI